MSNRKSRRHASGRKGNLRKADRHARPHVCPFCREPLESKFEGLETRLLLATFNVDTFTDVVDAGDGKTSLREAVIASNQSPGADTINLLAGTYTLAIAGALENAAAKGDLDLTDKVGTLTIQGAAQATTFVDAAGIDRVFQVLTGVTVIFQDMEIINGHAHDDGFKAGSEALGGGILSAGTVTLTRVTLATNVAHGDDGVDGTAGTAQKPNGAAGTSGGPARGGGIFATGTLTITGSTLSSNTALGGQGGDGGSGYTQPAAAAGKAGASGGSGGAGGNSAYAEGGGIYAAKTLTLTDTSVTGNAAQAGTPGDGGSGGKGGNGGAGMSGGGGGAGAKGGASAHAIGGGIYAAGSLAVTGTSISDNQATSPDGGDGGSGGAGGAAGTKGKGGKGGAGAAGAAGSYAKGGGIYAPAKGVLALTDSHVESNRASAGSGGYGGDGGNGGSGAAGTDGGSGGNAAAAGASGSAEGGGIWTGADLVVDGGTVYSNRAAAGDGEDGGDGGSDGSAGTGKQGVYGMGADGTAGSLARGGGAYVIGKANIKNAQFNGNHASGGDGGSGGSGFNGGDGGNGGLAEGGGLYVLGSVVTIESSTFNSNRAEAGSGSSGSSCYGGVAGNGGAGGNASGGGLYVAKATLTITDATISDNLAYAGSGSSGGSSSDDSKGGQGGDGGKGGSAMGGGIYLGGGTLCVTRITMNANEAEAGEGGDGGDGGDGVDSTAAGKAGGKGGDGGDGAPSGFAKGGAIYFPGGKLDLTGSTFTRNNADGDAQGGDGGAGGDGADGGPGGKAGKAAKGGDAAGGAIYAVGNLELVGGQFGTKDNGNYVDGGDGGDGADGGDGGKAGIGGSAGHQANGGDGGDAGFGHGGAVYAGGNVIVTDTQFIDNSAEGGSGSDGGSGFNGGRGGRGGDSFGGGLYVGGSELVVTGAAFTSNLASGESAGSGSDGDDSFGIGGVGGSGGLGRGGGLYIGVGKVTITNTTFRNNDVLAGDASSGGDGHTGGNAGQAGSSFGGGAFIGGGTVTIRDSNFSSNSVTDCSGDSGGSGDGGPAGLSSDGGACRGGGLYVGSGTLVLTNCTFEDNVAEGSSGGDGSQGYSGANGARGGPGEGGGLYATVSSLTITDCTFSGNYAQGGSGGDGGSATDDGGLPGNGGTGGVARGGGLYAACGKVVITRGTFDGNSAMGSQGGEVDSDGVPGAGGPGQGGAIYLAGGAVTITGVTFSNNDAKGGRACDAGGTSGQAGPAAAGQGGAIYVAGGTIAIQESTLDGNTAQGGDGKAVGIGMPGASGLGQGGGVYVVGGTVVLTGNTIGNNEALGGRGWWGQIVHTGGWTDPSTSAPNGAEGGNGQGGGLYVGGGAVTISMGSFAANHAMGGPGADRTGIASSGGNGEGGGLFMAGGTVTVTGVPFTDNWVEGQAGGVAAGPWGGENNGGDGRGGAIFYGGGVLTYLGGVGGVIERNSALGGPGGNLGGSCGSGLGGGIYVDLCSLTISDTAIRFNTAKGPAALDGSDSAGGDASGGGIYAKDATVQATNVQFVGNSATGGSGARSVTEGVAGFDGGAAYGGGAYGTGSVLTFATCVFQENTARGGTGGDGMAAVSNPAGSPGGQGGDASGGAIYVEKGFLAVTGGSILDNLAYGGDAGDGGGGSSTNRSGGDGGDAGAAYGGGISADRASVAINSPTISGNTALGGLGGTGADGYSSFTSGGNGGAGGNGGDACGGGIYLTSSTLTVLDTTISSSAATGGEGGVGGQGAPGFAGGSGGAGGVGGAGGGGGIYSESSDVTVVGTSALAGNTATGGDGGVGGEGVYSAVGGAGGLSGDGEGGGLYAADSRLAILAGVSNNAASGGDGGDGGDSGSGTGGDGGTGGYGGGGGLRINGTCIAAFDGGLLNNAVHAGLGGSGGLGGGSDGSDGADGTTSPDPDIFANVTLTQTVVHTLDPAGGTGSWGFKDSQHNEFTVALTGKGAKGYVVRDVQDDADGDILAIVAAGTSGASSLTITPKVKGCQTGMGGITVMGPIGGIAAPAASPWADVMVAGALKTLALCDFGSAITVGPGGPKDALSISVRQGVSVKLVSAIPIASLTAVGWFSGSPDDLGVIQAPRLGTLSVADQFAANLQLTGIGLAPKIMAMDAATIKGDMLFGDWDITGAVGKVTVGGAVGSPTAPWGLWGASSVGGLTFGDVVFAELMNVGAVGDVKAQRWQQGSISAAQVKSITITGAANCGVVTVPGDFGADLFLSGEGVPAKGNTLDKVSIAGNLSTGWWEVTGKVGMVTVKGTVGDAGGWFMQGRTSVGSLTFGDVVSGVIDVDGRLGDVKAIRWQDGQIMATAIKSLAVTGRAATPTQAAISGDLAVDVTLYGKDETALGALTVAGWVESAGIYAEGRLGKLTVGGMRNAWIGAGNMGTTDYENQRSIDAFTVLGIKGETEVFIGSNVSAWALGKIVMTEVQTTAGGDFGLNAHGVDNYTRGTVKFMKQVGPQTLDLVDQYAVRLV